MPSILDKFLMNEWRVRCFYIIDFYSLISKVSGISWIIGRWQILVSLEWMYFFAVGECNVSVGLHDSVQFQTLLWNHGNDWRRSNKFVRVWRQTNQVLHGEGASSAIFWGTNFRTYSRISFDEILFIFRSLATNCKLNYFGYLQL